MTSTSEADRYEAMLYGVDEAAWPAVKAADEAVGAVCGIAGRDPEALGLYGVLRAHLNLRIATAITQARHAGISWELIADKLGMEVEEVAAAYGAAPYLAPPGVQHQT